MAHKVTEKCSTLCLIPWQGGSGTEYLWHCAEREGKPGSPGCKLQRLPPRAALTRCSARSPRCSRPWPCSTASSRSGKQRGGKSSASSGCTWLPGREPLSTRWLPRSYLLGYRAAFLHEVLETSVEETYYSAE